jgi:hypothetical protein
MKKCTPITQRAKSSPLRADISLIQGAGMVAKPFNDYSQMFKGIPEPKAADLVTKPKLEEDGENGNDENNNDENKEE